MDRLETRQLTMADMPPAEKILKEEYCTRTPAACHLRVPAQDIWVRMKPVVEGCVKHSICYGVFDKSNGSMCGIAMGYLGNNAPQPGLDHSFPLCMKQLIKFYEADGLKEFVTKNDVTNYMELYVVCVKKGYEKRGIGAHLTKVLLKRARELGCDFAVVSSNSAFSRRILQKLGFSVIKEIVFEDYVDAITGDKVFQGIAKLHYASTLMSSKL